MENIVGRFSSELLSIRAKNGGQQLCVIVNTVYISVYLYGVRR